MSANSVLAQDLGPIGPKAGGGSSPEKSNTSSVNLPYKPSGTDSSDVKAKSKSAGGKNKTVGQPSKDNSSTQEEDNEIVIPLIFPKYPPSTGAPDIGDF